MIIYLIDRFENLSSEELTNYWEASCEHLYLSELKLLSQVNRSRFSQFILDYGVKRGPDIYKEAASQLIKRLSALPEYEAIIKEGKEEAIISGKEEINYIKKDVDVCPLPFFWEIISHTIQGNLKVIEKTV